MFQYPVSPLLSTSLPLTHSPLLPPSLSIILPFPLSLFSLFSLSCRCSLFRSCCEWKVCCDQCEFFCQNQLLSLPSICAILILIWIFVAGVTASVCVLVCVCACECVLAREKKRESVCVFVCGLMWPWMYICNKASV